MSDDNSVYERLKDLPAVHGLDDPESALNHYRSFERRAKQRRRVQRTAAVAMLIAFVVVISIPATRGVARQLFDRFYTRRLEAVRSTETAIGAAGPFHMEYAESTPARFVSDVSEARQQAGFEPRLPATLVEQLASGLAVLKVAAPIDGRFKIDVNNLLGFLSKRGIDDVNVPRNWEGVEISFHISAGIFVHFLGGMLGQAQPPALVTPPGFQIIDFTEVALRAAGLSASAAHNARHMFVDTGGMFSIVPADAKSRFREVSLKTGPGLLFENDTDEDERRKCSMCAGPHERVLTWTAPDRAFQLRSQTMELDQIIQMANAIN